MTPHATSGTTRHIVVMGVSGCGKSTVAQGIADRLGLVMGEADEFHPQANIDKMTAGTPLTDEDRWPWLRDLSAWMAAQAQEGRSTVVACSALRRAYRDVLREGPPSLILVHLAGPMEVIAQRMAAREHFMPPSLLQSQFDTLEALEADQGGIVLDLGRPADDLIDEAVHWLSTDPGSPCLTPEPSAPTT